MNVIETNGLSKAFGSKMAVHQFDMHVGQGDIYGFVGRNGAGKSTVMRMLAGLAAPTGGEVRVFGMQPREASASRRIGALIESPGLYGSMSATDNLMMKALALGLADPKDKVHGLLDLTGLGSVGSKATKNFSMGMKQRLGLALALLGSPDLLLLDEPLNGLDPEGAREIRRLIMRLNDERGITVVVSSHVLEQLGKMATRYGVIREGRMVREMSAAEVDQECSDFLQLEAANPTLALAVLQERFAGLRFQSMPDGAIRVFGGADAGAVGAVLNEQGIAVRGLYAHRRDLEEFFVEMMGAEYRG
ncbi:ATP-binding cassette domain-containing protein [Gordonibacter urolithinfaciens]|uniref:ABC transporter n=1 Tax=Gordonibacter urolithinfaciens TaxID=1335613 RepID=A0A423UGY1_9ACTN|nr:ATP-binding cassette domain-containing protein [Gordonibacter urolithinfaciens]MBS6975469.1 ATP-binding cassette domain-containing protein [Eggerthellaceae bacterium]MCB6562072.1 ATP-binding cassette domain-containing protein [Gordonibacter urolithinfaciens]MCB7086416.1 ATP-binding cassette domain-containing protein [Gordonibacter urolithinfaciens]MSA95840.1 ATP-binding cassette domain-containing protein [Gordonibacter urolithinfaciens]ROT87984.1 ABC transporter [Gordonibacter urolithinfaci